MASILQQIGTPLQFVALFLLLVAGIARLLVRKDSAEKSTTLKRLVINRLFAVAVLALIVGTAAGLLPTILERYVNGDEVFHCAVLTTEGDPVPNANINLLTISSVTTNASGQVDINVPRSRVRKQYEIEVRAPGYRSTGIISKSDADMRSFEIQLAPAPEDLVKALEPDLIVGQFFGAPLVLATFRVENTETSTLLINDIHATLMGSGRSLRLVPVSWSIMSPFVGGLIPLSGALPIFAGARVDLRVVMTTGENFSALTAQTGALPEYRREPPCTPRYNAVPEPLTPAAYRITKDFAVAHFDWYPGAWKLQIAVTTDRSDTFTRDFTLSADEVDHLRRSIALLRQCLGVNASAPLAEDGQLSNFLSK